MNVHAPLAQDVRVAQEVIEQLHAAGIFEDDPDFATLLEAESDLPNRLESMIRRAHYVEAQSKALAGLITEMRDRKGRLDHQAEKLRHIAMHAMLEAGLPRIAAPDFTASVSKTRPAVVVSDSNAVPDSFCQIKREPDKTKIREFLEGGLDAPWAQLGNPGHQLKVSLR